ncbi:dihydroorotase [Neisseriaceae bacterium TC5R-5]|nr:dihydroorotase [Neisseriaceae bacterium TC5R-5]
MQTLTLIRPDDWHLHLRDEAALHAVLPATCQQMGRAIIMPNLKPPITTVTAAAAYRERILAARPTGSHFEPLMTLYLTDNTPAAEIRQAKASGFIHGIKLYPAGATTNSDFGVSKLDKALPALEAMAEIGMPLLVHGEVTDANIDIFDREAVFIEQVFQPLLASLPSLRVVFEHITTQQAADFVTSAPANIAATITAHHLLMNRNALLVGGIRPHHYCLPVLKRERHRQALLAAASSGSSKFFLGTDSAPHTQHSKETSCGCAGMYTAHAAIELYAEAFDSIGALDKLEAFASRNGPAFYGLPINQDHITLTKENWNVPTTLPYGTDRLIPLRAGETIAWKLQH